MRRPIPEHVKKNLFHLRQWANGLRGLYGVPIYLVGSALSGNNPDPRDWDVRVIIPNADFERRFGNVQEWENEGLMGKWTRIRWRWADECVKRTQDGWRHCGLNIDFQIYPKSHAAIHYPRAFPRLRLDNRPYTLK